MTIKDFARWLITKNLGKETIKSYLRYYKLFDEVASSGDLSQNIVNQFMIDHPSNVTRAFLNNLFEFYDIDKFKVPKITGRKAKKKRRSISPQEIKVMRGWLFHHKNERYLIAFDLSYYCALRRSEVMGILLGDFELKTWAENPDKPCRLKIRGKGRKERFVVVPPKLMQRVIEFIKENPDLNLESRILNFAYTKWHVAFKDAVKSTMDHNYTLHDLRRSCATKWLNEGIPMIKIRNRLGHASISTTQLYINEDEEKELSDWENEY